MSVADKLREIYFLSEDLEEILRKRFGIDLERFLESEISKKHLEYALNRVIEDLFPEKRVIEREELPDKEIVLHLVLLGVSGLDDNDLRNTIIEREVDRLMRHIYSTRDLDEARSYLIELANIFNLRVRLCEKQLVIYRSVDKKGKIKTDIYDAKIDLIDYIRFLASHRLHERYPLEKLPVSGGFVYIKLLGEETEITLLSVLREIIREKMRELVKRYSVYRDNIVLKEFVSRIMSIRSEFYDKRKSLQIMRIARKIEIIKRHSLEWDEALFPQCVRTVINRLREGSEVRGEEIYLLATFLAYTSISLEDLRENIPETHRYLINIITRIRDRSREGVYYPPPPCSYIKKVMGLVDEECSYRDPLTALMKRILERSKSNGNTE